jgi:hypothetical protein
MKIKNYTSGISVEKSVMLIEKTLVEVGATHIAKVYDNNKDLAGITFQIQTNGMPLVFRLPSKWKEYTKLLERKIKKPHRGTIERIREQSKRTAWKLLLEWVQIQVSMIQLQQAEIIEVFLPYAYDMNKDETFFDKLKGTQFKQLTQ